MKNIERWVVFLFIFLIVGGTLGALYYAQNGQLRKDIGTRLADLRDAKSKLDAAQADLTAAQKDLFFTPGKVLTVDEKKALQARVDKDQSDVETYTTQILGDISFLQRNWTTLTQEERDYVQLIKGSLGSIQ